MVLPTLQCQAEMIHPDLQTVLTQHDQAQTVAAIVLVRVDGADELCEAFRLRRQGKSWGNVPA